MHSDPVKLRKSILAELGASGGSPFARLKAAALAQAAINPSTDSKA